MICIPSLSSTYSLSCTIVPQSQSHFHVVFTEGVSNRQYWTPSILKPASIFTLEYTIVDLKPPSVRATIKEKEFFVKNEIFKECDATLETILPNCACISTFWEPPPLPPEKPFEVAVSWIHFRFLLYIECINSTSYSRLLDIV